MKLTKRTIDALACPVGRRDVQVTDDEIPGFAVRVTAGGAKVFLLQYRFGTAVRRQVIGQYGQITPAQARRQAQRLRGEVLAGGDPVAERRARQAAAALDRTTLDDVITAWESRQLENRRASYSREAVRALRVNLKPHLAKAAAAIDAEQAVRIIDSIEDDRGGAMARRTLAYARAVYGWAVRRRMLSTNPFAGLDAPGKDIARDRVLSDAELAEVWRAMGSIGDPFDDCLRLLLLTLQRRSEVGGMRWSELDAARTVWTIPAERAKNGREHVVHLAPAAQEILRQVKRQGRAELVFTTTGKTPLAGFGRAKARLDAAIVEARVKQCRPDGEPEPFPAWRFHDFRRTGVTVLARLGTPPHVSDRLLNHVSGTIRGVAAVYQRHEFMVERQAALETWAAHIKRLVSS